jgi:NitT/TauT family transport system substrate-binding protein
VLVAQTLVSLRPTDGKRLAVNEMNGRKAMRTRVKDCWIRLCGLLLLIGRRIGRAAGPRAERTSFNVAWSIYVGWMPWDYADRSGILKKWADKYGIKIKLTQINDYVESINQYTAGTFDACAMTNMDMLTIPAAGGVDSTALIVGDYSNGNDGVVLKGKGKTLADIKGQKVNLVELSVSHYLLVRALGTIGLRERDLKIVNTSDADIVAAFSAPATTAVVTWKPQLSAVLAAPDAQLVFDSSKIPGEISISWWSTARCSPPIRSSARRSSALGTRRWPHAQEATPRGRPRRPRWPRPPAPISAGFRSQLATTHLFATPAEAYAFITGDGIVKTMDLVRIFPSNTGFSARAPAAWMRSASNFPLGANSAMRTT